VPLLMQFSCGSSIDAIWEHPAHLRSARFYGQGFFVINLDHRGFGASDPVPAHRVADLDERIEDILAVLDAVGAERVSVLGENDGAMTAVKLAVEHPDRVERLVLLNPTVCGIRRDDFPTGPDPADVEAAAAVASARWGLGECIALVVPTMADDLDLLARFERCSASRASIVAAINNLARADVRHLVPDVRQPSLVVRTNDFLSADTGQFGHLAAHLADVETGVYESSSFYWGGGLFERIQDFLCADGPRTRAVERDLATLLMTDIVDSTAHVVNEGDRRWRTTLDAMDELVLDRIERFGGALVKQTGDGHLVEFRTPSGAIHAASAIRGGARQLGLHLRAGIHVGEVERRDGGDLGGITVHTAARIAAAAAADEILVSRTVAELAAGSTFVFTERGRHMLKGVPGAWDLLAVDADG
jgi:class 3 adenylate cyclase/pimeloyl-ACP methyl ester carboxylesterase